MKKQTRSKIGRPEHVATVKTRERVTLAVAHGITQRAICMVMGIGPNTLTKYYSQELEFGLELATEGVARRLYDEAMSKNGRDRVRAMESWLKMRARWKETTAAEISAPGGVPLAIQVEFVETKK